jgi:iron complex outermembrane receptor protein
VGLAASTLRVGGNLRMIDPTQIGKKLGYAASSKRDSVRLKVEADVTSDLTATLGYNYGRVSAPMNLFTPHDFVAPTFPQPPLRATDYETFSYNYANRADTITNEATLTLAWKTPIGMLTSYSGYTRRGFDIAYDFDGTYADLTSSTLLSRQRSYQQSVDLVVDTIKDVDLVVGGLYFDDKFGKPGYGGLTNFGANRAFGSLMRIIAGTEAWAGYADATWHVTDKLSLNLGGRYSWEKKTVTQTTFGPGGIITFPTTTRDASFSKFTPRASIRYEIEPRTNVYASYSQGFRSGTFNTSGVASPALLVPIRPEKVDAFEVGFKTNRSRLRFDVSGFYYDYTDLNVALLVPFPGCTVNCPIANILSNAPKAKIYGIDGQATLAVTDQLNLTVSGAWLHARYGDFTNAVGTGLSAVTGLNIPGQQQDWSGQQMSRAPNFSGSVTLDYKTQMAGGQLLLSGNANYAGAFPVQNPSIYGPAAPAALRDKQRYRRKSTFLINAQATWTDPTDHYWVTVFGRNLTDQKYLALYNGANFGDYGAIAPPISYGATIGYKF